MPRVPLPISLALAAALVAGCGSSTHSTPNAPVTGAQAKPAPGAGGLTVTATDARLGDATRADSSGKVDLLKVTRPVDPSKLKLQARRHQGVGAGAACTDVDVMPGADSMAAVITATLCLLNGERADAGLPA